jgi:flagellar M-ring protein FliF
MFDFSKADYFYIAELSITLLISLFFILFVIRPLVKRVLEPEKNDIVIDLVEHESQPADGDQNTPATTEPPINRLEDLEAQLAGNKTAQNIEEAKMTGQIHAEAIKQIGTLVQNNPKEATAVIRQWISNEDMEAA